jgi:hypothetical protein
VTVRSALNHLLMVLGESKRHQRCSCPHTSTSNCRSSASTQAMYVGLRLQHSSHGGSGLDVTWLISFPRGASKFRGYRRNKSETSSLPSVAATDRALHR